MKIMTKRKKAIVIGSGIGGLICALELAKNNYSVTVLEKNLLAGGYCASFQKKGYTFDIGPHFLTAIGQRENIIGNYLYQLPIKTKLIKLKYFDKFFINGEKFTNPTNLKKYIKLLQTRFPKEKNNITNFFQEIKNILFYYQINTKQKYATITFKEFLDLFFKDKLLKKVLSVFTRYIEETPERSWAVNCAALLGSIFYYGVYYPAEGMGAIPKTLVENLELAKSKIIFQAKATEILIKNKKAIGVKYIAPGQKETILKADVIISNSSLEHTFLELVPRDLLSSNFLRDIKQITPGISGIILQLGLKKLPRKYSQKAGVYYLNNKSRKIPKNLRGNFFAISILTNYSKKIAPKNRVVLRMVTCLPSQKNYADPHNLSKKLKIYYLNILQNIFPSIEKNIEVYNIFSPLSFAKLTNNTAGSFVGPSNIPKNIKHQHNLSGETPIGNLYLAGHWAHGMTGVQGAFVSGLLTARKIISQYAKK